MTLGEPPVIVVPATPTSNGGLHVGHLAGPYLAADVYARYQRARGRFVLHTTCTDDSQSYVATRAAVLGVPPAELARDATARIGQAFTALGATLPGLPPIDETYRRTVLDHVAAQHRAGAFELRTVRFPYARRAGVCLYDAFVAGTCPTCLAQSSGGACEACGHPNNFDELLDPYYPLDPADEIEYREVEILVLPLERLRAQLTDYYARHTPRWRPNARDLITELMAGPLPDVPVTVPGDWGLPAPFAETPGQRLYPWIEAMPAVIYSTWWSAAQLGRPAERVDQFWLGDQEPTIVYFHGYDNVFHWGMLDLAMLLSHPQPYATPTVTVTNEFYELERSKFSTSRDHLVSATDLLDRVPRDLARFYLALTAPEFQRTNFTEADLRHVVDTRLVQPWNRLAGALAGLAVPDGTVLPVSTAGRTRARTVADRLSRHYRDDRFSPAGVADTLATQLERLARTDLHADSVADVLAQVQTLLAYAAPVLIDVTGTLAAAGVPLRIDDRPLEKVTMFRLPTLPAASDQRPVTAAGRAS
ncbi:class I tRNA ligase family protein [Micromonospora chalcea]|uniref:class I tRNA ligase family protein n=1 Tax=Micromonospora chalcea TaxID=1874 RepID=UPI00157C9564|nr:class I tRNA ligase family protein [Micromonospora chalcea]